MSRIEAPVLANQVLAAVSAVFSWAVKQEVVGTNPCRGVDRNATRSRERVISDSELPRFLVRLRRGWASRRRFEDDAALRSAPRRGKPHEARAHRRWLVGDAGRLCACARLARDQERREQSGLVAQGGAGGHLRPDRRWRDQRLRVCRSARRSYPRPRRCDALHLRQGSASSVRRRTICGGPTAAPSRHSASAAML